MNIENAATGVIENVIEDAPTQKKNDDHARVQASANGAVNEMWLTKVAEHEDKVEIGPVYATESSSVSVGAQRRGASEFGEQC